MKIKNEWQKIGIINIMVEKNDIADIGDIIIGNDEPFHYIGSSKIPNRAYQYRIYRGKGIGSKSIQYFIEYLRENGIKEIRGELSSRDDYEKASKFWKKFDFKIEKIEDSNGPIIAKIYKKL
jgi:GNAT superfamily N-acetyltransferase